MRTPRLRLSLALLTVAFLALAACGDSGGTGSGTTTTAAEAKEVAFAFVGPLTGDNANLGINPRNGAKLAIEQANEANKGKFTFVLKEFDTQGDPAQATTLKDKFVNDDEVLGIIGPVFSGETKAVLPDLEAASLVMVSPSATGVDIPTVVPGGKAFHRIVPDDGVQGAGVVNYVTKELNVKSAAYVHDNADYGKGLADGTKKLLEAAGVTSTVTDAIDPKSQDFSAAVNKVKAAKADLVYYGGYYAEGGRLKKQLTDAGVKGIFLSGDGALDLGFITAAGAAGAEGAQMTCACNVATETSEGDLAQFAKDYEAAFKTPPGTYSTEGYDVANLLIKGVVEGNDTRAKLLAFVEGLDVFPGLGKEISFEDNGNVKAKGVFLFKVTDGKITLVGSTDDL